MELLYEFASIVGWYVSFPQGRYMFIPIFNYGL